MAEDLTLAEISTQGLDNDLNSNFTALENAVNSKADDTSVVHLAGVETITGDKTFSSESNVFHGDGSALTGITSDQIAFNGTFIYSQAYPTTYDLVANTWTKITENVVVNDVSNNFDVVNQRVNITKPGIYLIMQKVTPKTVLPTTQVAARITVNGNSYGTDYNYGGTCWVQNIRILNVGDYVEYYAYSSVNDKVYTTLHVVQLSN